MLYAIYRMTAIYNPTTGIIAKVTFEIEIRKMMEEINNSSLVCFVGKPSPLGLCSTERLTRPHHFLCGSRKTPRDGLEVANGTRAAAVVANGTLFRFAVLLMSAGWPVLSMAQLQSLRSELTRAGKQRDGVSLHVEPAGIHSEAIYRLLRNLDDLRGI